MKTGILGTFASGLGKLTLGAASVLGDVVEGTPGLVLLYRCDDPAAQSAVVERFGRNATVNLGTTAYTAGTEGVDDFSLQTPNAASSVDVTPHLSFAYTGGTLDVGSSATVECWFRPSEFGPFDMVSGGGPVSPDYDWEVLRLASHDGVKHVSFVSQPFNSFETRSIKAVWSGDSDTTISLDTFGADPVLFQTGRWFYLAMTWDGTRYTLYLNGTAVATNTTGLPPSGLTACDFSFGKCGGQYDLVSVSNRVLTDAEIASRFTLGTGTTTTTTEVRATNVLASYAAAYDAKARVTQEVREVLRTGSRSGRVTQEVREVLRSVASLTVLNRSVTQTLAFADHAYHTRVGTDSQTLVFTQTAVGNASFPVDQTLAFTQTATHTTEHVRSLLQVLPLVQSEPLGHDADVGVSQGIVFVETASLGRESADTRLQVLGLTDAASGHVAPHPQSLAQSLVFVETTATEHQKRRTATDQLLFGETLGLRRVYHRTISQSLVFAESVPRPPSVRRRGVTDRLGFYEGDYPLDPSFVLGGDHPVVTVPVARLVRVFPAVVFESKTSAVVLPTPEWDDTEQSYDKLSVKRSMTGVFSVYVQTSQTVTLNYTFTLGRRKALEFRKFVAENLSQLVRLTNWKAETFVGQFLTNPLNLTTSGRYAGGYEKVTVTIEFEGVRL